MQYSKKAAFINREKELAYLDSWIAEEPEHILFVYGPKSSGKTTLITRFAEKHLHDSSQFSLKVFNLREVLLVSYQDFLQCFFQIVDPDEQTTSQTRHYDVKLFKLTMETHRHIKNKNLDPFEVMKKELQALNDRGIRPVIMIDELQALESIYFNSQRELIKEMLNFFVAMTKEAHLCHVLLASSDGYFIEKVYSDSKLKKTAKFFEVDYLPKDDITYWLNNLHQESGIEKFTLTPSQVEYVWEHFGGSIWEISALLGDLLPVAQGKSVSDHDIQDVCQKYMTMAQSHFIEYATLDESKTALLHEINTLVKENGCFQEKQLMSLLKHNHFPDRAALHDELVYLVKNNFLYYDPTRAEYRIQGRSMEIGLMNFV